MISVCCLASEQIGRVGVNFLPGAYGPERATIVSRNDDVKHGWTDRDITLEREQSRSKFQFANVMLL